MGMLKPEKTSDDEVHGLIYSGHTRLKDASDEFLGIATHVLLNKLDQPVKK